MAVKRVKLTDRIVKSLETPEKGNKLTYDSEVKGFAIRVTKNGARAFILNYHFEKRERRITIGSFPDWSTVDARETAKGYKRQIDMGNDPLSKRMANRDAPTVKDLFQRYKKEHLPQKEKRSASDDQSMWETYILPRFGNEKLANLTASDIDAFHRAISETKPVRANRVIEVFRKAYNLAIRWDWVSRNPCEGVQMNTVDPRHRYASFDELEAIFEAMAYHDKQTSCDVIRFLILTGARKGEVLQARWQDIDLINGIWTKPSSHTKQKKMHRVPLSAGATELLRKRFKSKSGQWVFPSSVTDGHLVDFKRTWISIKKQASLALWKQDANIGAFMMELEDRIGKPVTYEIVKKEAKAKKLDLGPEVTDLRVHDLRHTYASILASQGHSLALIGALLGHSQTQTTKRYAHLLDDPLREATNQVDAFLKVG